jgi:transitional endoplasmic reticulum ATPase
MIVKKLDNSIQVPSGFVYLNDKDLKEFGWNENSIITIKGKRETCCVLKEDKNCPPNSILVDEVMMDNISIKENDNIEINLTNASKASFVHLIPASKTKRYLKKGNSDQTIIGSFLKKRNMEPRDEDDVRSNKQLINGIAFTKGDWIKVPLEGREFIFKIAKTIPSGNLIFTPETKIEIEDDLIIKSKNVSLSFDDIGGLKNEIERVKEMVQTPLLYPEVFKQIGIDAPRGLLLYGPPGCGKTLIARAVAYETGVNFYNINGPEIIKQHYGESEQKLRDIFEDAESNSPSIIFFDEIDALAPSRETVLGDVEKRVVSQMLTLMDGLKSRGQIVVIAATNLPNNLDPALRRPGRFDREIAINPPNKDGRFEILNIHSRKMPLNKDVNLKLIAEITHGFIGADLAALCREASINCIKDFLPRIDSNENKLSESEIKNLKVKMIHFQKALQGFELTSTRELSTEIPDVRWNDIGGLENIKRILMDTIELPLKYGDRFRKLNARFPKGVLLTGAPGTGKTLLIKALARESGVNFISIKGPELLSKWVGESERGIREIFKKARQTAPTIIFFDEIDSIFPERGGNDGNSNISDRMLAQFLLELDNIDPLRRILVVSATNRPDLIDKGLLRPGRFDYIIDIPMPDFDARLAILNVLKNRHHFSSDISIQKLAEQTKGMSGAEIDLLCQQAAMMCIRESIIESPENKSSILKITLDHLQKSLINLSSQKAV